MTPVPGPRRFGPESKAQDVIAGIDLGGRVAIVTGASGGLGAETARALASAGARVLLGVRDLAKGEAAAQSIRAAHADAQVAVSQLELASPASVRAFAARFLASEPALHILVNNAGVMACPLSRTPEGWELQFATNHLGHFLLTLLLLPALRAGAPSRVVNLSSGGHRIAGVDLADPHFERRAYDKWQAYGQSKSANVLFSVEFERRFAHEGIHANAVHPGAIVTELGRHMSRDDMKDLLARAPAGKGFTWKSIEAGAATAVWAASAPELEGRGGLYLEDCAIAGPSRSMESDSGYVPHAMDPAAAAALWRLSEKLTGCKV